MSDVVFSGEVLVFLKLKANDFVESPKFASFVSWMDEAIKKNEPAILSENPPNHSFDLADGTMDLAVGDRQVGLKRQQHRDLAEGLFAFTIEKAGSFTEVLAFVGQMRGEAQLEAAMAFYVASQHEFLSSSQQWCELAKKFGWNMPELLENPFYKGVCEQILKVFRERGWI